MKIPSLCRIALLSRTENGKAATFWAAVFAGIWLLLQCLSGFLLGYEATGVSAGACVLTLLGILGRELLRALLSALPKAHRFWAGLGLALTFAAAECLLAGDTANNPERLWSEFLPTFAQSALLTALAMQGGLLPALLYGMAAQAMGHWIPVSPALSRQMAALLELVVNMMFLVVLDCDLSPDEAPTHRPKLRVAGGAAAGALLVALVCFFVGLLPWQPVAIATGSMEPQISVGDMVLISKLDTGALQAGDVIQFRKGSHTVVHRIVEVIQEDGALSYVTKGDANNANDAGTVSAGEVVGKVIATVPGAGRWTLWLHGTE